MPDDAPMDRQARVASLLEDHIRTELQVQNDAADLSLPQNSIARLAWAVTAEVLYAFSVDWSPDWVKPGQVHTWQESRDFFARCPACLQDSPRSKNPRGRSLLGSQPPGYTPSRKSRAYPSPANNPRDVSHIKRSRCVAHQME